MERKSQVQIPKDLLLALFQYHLAGNEEYLPEIEKALMEKLDSMVKRQLYTIFKTAPTEEEREEARQEYFLNRVFCHDFTPYMICKKYNQSFVSDNVIPNNSSTASLGTLSNLRDW